MRVLANSVPKSGTHLLLRLLDGLGMPKHRRVRIDPDWTLERSLPRRLGMTLPGLGSPVPIGRGVTVSSHWLRSLFRRMPARSALLGHAWYSEELSELLVDCGLRTVCIVRDPRDVAVSLAHFLMRIGKSRITRKPEHRALVALPDHGARLLALLRGRPGTPSIGERYDAFLGWRRHPGVCFVRFEDLVGAAGGGGDELQRESVGRVAGHLGLEHTSERIAAVCTSLFGGTATFRKGTLGQWHEEFGPEHRVAARDELTDVLAELGYPPTPADS